LAQEEIKKIIVGTNKKKIDYIIHTNGLLLDKIDPFILENINALFISIDGIPEIHDYYKGKGNYSLIMRNLEKIRLDFREIILARLTVPISNYTKFQYSLMESIENILNSGIFDAVHWQIENSPGPCVKEESDAFLKGYCEDLEDLGKYWMSSLRKGSILKIIPIQTMANDLINNKRYNNFPCGCNERLVVIDCDGECYLCDEMIGKEKYKIGNVEKGIKFFEGYTCKTVNVQCNKCEYKETCGGRCLNSCLLYPKDMFVFYCQASKGLINTMEKHLQEIRNLISYNLVNKEEFKDWYANYTEKRP